MTLNFRSLIVYWVKVVLSFSPPIICTHALFVHQAAPGLIPRICEVSRNLHMFLHAWKPQLTSTNFLGGVGVGGGESPPPPPPPPEINPAYNECSNKQTIPLITHTHCSPPSLCSDTIRSHRKWQSEKGVLQD